MSSKRDGGGGGRRHGRRRPVGIAVLLIVLAGAAFFVLADDAPVDDQDVCEPLSGSSIEPFRPRLAGVHPVDPGSGNGALVALVSASLLPGSGDNEELWSDIADAARRNRETLDQLQRVIAGRDPGVSSGEQLAKSDEPRVDLVPLTALLRLAFSDRMHRQDFEAAARSAWQLFQLGASLSRAPGSLGDFQDGQVILEFALREICTVGCQKNWSLGSVRRELLRLKQGGIPRLGLHRALAREYCRIADEIRDGLPSGLELGSWPRFLVYRPTRTRNRIAEGVRALRPDLDLRFPPLRVFDPPDAAASRWSGNAAGDRFAHLVLERFARPVHAIARLEKSVALVRLALAIRCYEMQVGEMPESLSKLPEAYLDQEAFAGPEKHFHYSPTVRSLGYKVEGRAPEIMGSLQIYFPL